LWLPLAAIFGPALALPARPQFFAFRLLFGLTVILAVVAFIADRRLPRLGPRHIVLLFAAWFAWLVVALLWAPVPADGFRYLAILFAEFVLMAVVAGAGDDLRRLRFVVYSLAAGYCLAVLVGAGEAITGRHLQSSAGAHGGKRHIATGFFYNPNDLATFIAIAWPFLLFGLLFSRRLWQKGVLLLFMALGLFALAYTGSRSGMIGVALTTLLTGGFVVVRRWVRHRGLIVAAAVIALVVSVGIAFNTSQSAVLRQFQVQSLDTSAQKAQQSGGNSATARFGLTHAGLHVAADYWFMGVGPGNAENQVRLQPGTPSNFANLHDWWLEVFVVGGVPALILYVLIYAALLAASFRAAAHSGDRFTRITAAATGIALIGYVVGSLGPSTVLTFTPMWVLFGLAIALARRRHWELVTAEAGLTTSTGDPTGPTSPDGRDTQASGSAAA
ncbi:MAG TPA: O-antigen ligase family protein, partial [Thermoleophilia bacterium]|nr:O-antigen ligase family protein [Thermoleophilia bacterium]